MKWEWNGTENNSVCQKRLASTFPQLFAPESAPTPLYFGGSFNPFHRGHAAVLVALQKHFPQLSITLLPNRVSPLKLPGTPLSTLEGSEAQHWPGPAQKIALLHAVLEDMVEQHGLPRSRLRLELCELQREGPSYTADTLRCLLKPSQDKMGKEISSKACILALGRDSFCALKLWKNWPYLLDVCFFVVLHRDMANPINSADDSTDGPLDREIIERADYLELKLDEPCSSSEIRRKLASPEDSQQEQLEWLLGPRQLACIREYGLYVKN